MTVVLLWTLAFIIPAFSFGVPIPHAPYVLIPALAVSAGLTDRHALRRVLIWLGLVLLYELIYQVPPGTLAAPVAVMSVLHVGSSYVIRMESSKAAMRNSSSSALVMVTVAFIWLVGLIVLTALWGSVFADTGSFSVSALYTVWWSHNALVSAMTLTAIVQLVLYAEQYRGIRTFFTDHAVIQAQHIPD
jgi:hypothetical protein